LLKLIASYSTKDIKNQGQVEDIYYSQNKNKKYTSLHYLPIYTYSNNINKGRKVTIYNINLVEL